MSEHLPDDAYFTVAELARVFKVSVKTIYGWVEIGKLDAVTIGGRALRIPRDAAVKLIVEKN